MQGWADLVGNGYIPRWYTCRKTVTHYSTNHQAQKRRKFVSVSTLHRPRKPSDRHGQIESPLVHRRARKYIAAWTGASDTAEGKECRLRILSRELYSLRHRQPVRRTSRSNGVKCSNWPRPYERQRSYHQASTDLDPAAPSKTALYSRGMNAVGPASVVERQESVMPPDGAQLTEAVLHVHDVHSLHGSIVISTPRSCSIAA